MKAILVVDIPDDIFANKESLKKYCVVWTKYHINSLKPLPQKIEGYIDYEYGDGWNACIEEILGEEE